MNPADVLMQMWVTCAMFMVAGYVDDAAERHQSMTLKRVSALLMAAATVGLLALGVTLHRLR